MNPFKFLLGFLFSLFFAVQAQAQWQRLSGAEFTLPPPPAQVFWANEIDRLLQMQDDRNKEICEEAATQTFASFETLFVDSGAFTKKQAKILAPFMHHVLRRADGVARHFKNHYSRMRPYRFDSRVKPCIRTPSGSKSYPSSHAAQGMLGGCVLGLIFPERTEEMYRMGVRVGELRLWGGVHFPSDVRAGQELARAVCDRLQQLPDFLIDVEAVKEKL